MIWTGWSVSSLFVLSVSQDLPAHHAPARSVDATFEVGFLLYRACNLGEDVVRFATDEFDGGYDNDQNHRQHYGIFSNVLSAVVRPHCREQIRHFSHDIFLSIGKDVSKGGVAGSSEISRRNCAQ